MLQTAHLLSIDDRSGAQQRVAVVSPLVLMAQASSLNTRSSAAACSPLAIVSQNEIPIETIVKKAQSSGECQDTGDEEKQNEPTFSQAKEIYVNTRRIVIMAR